jgi:hypothetical protein
MTSIPPETHATSTTMTSAIDTNIPLQDRGCRLSLVSFLLRKLAKSRLGKTPLVATSIFKVNFFQAATYADRKSTCLL